MNANTTTAPVSPHAGQPAAPTKTRWLILFLISLMYLICYMDRSNISVAQPEIAKAFGLSKTSMALVLSAFTWSYALGQIPAGWLGDRFGPKRILTAIMSWWSIAAMMTGAALGLGSLFTARFFLGLGEAGAFPVASRGMQLWFPRSERGRIQGTTHFFSRFAVAITPFVAASILLAFGWRAIFYIFGSLGLLWSVAFAAYYRNRPEEHAGVNAAELAQIRGQNADPRGAAIWTPWKRILTSSNMWFISLGYCCFFFGTNFYLTWYPTYLREHRHITLQALGLLGSIPLFAGMAGDLVGGSLSDFVLKKTGRARLARSIVAAPGFLLSAVFLLPAATTESAYGLGQCAWPASFFFLEFVIGPAWAVPMDVGGQFSGTVTGHHEHGGRAGCIIHSARFWLLLREGLLVDSFITSGVMLLGAAIWTFLIHPERSVGDATPRRHTTRSSLCAPSPRPAVARLRQGKWMDLAPFPDPREEVMGEAANGKLYVFSGLIPLWHPAGLVYEYDPATNHWTKKKPMALPSHHVAFCEHDGKIYAFGGFVYPDPPAPAGWVPINNTLGIRPAERFLEGARAHAHQARRGGSRGSRRQDLCHRRRHHGTRREGPLHQFHDAPERGGNGRGVRSQNQHLAHAHAHADAAQSHGCRNRERENLCNRRPRRRCLHFDCIRHFVGGNLQPGDRRLGTSGSAHADRAQRRGIRRVPRQDLCRGRRMAGSCSTNGLPRIRSLRPRPRTLGQPPPWLLLAMA